MDILVCVKQVPSVSEGRLDRKTGTLLRADLPAVLNPYDARALEMALRLRDQAGGTVRVLTMGPASAVAVLREAIAMGADAAVLVSDSRFAGADAVATAYTLSQAIRTQPQADLIVCGRQSTDGDTGQVSGALAAFLDLPFASGVDTLAMGEEDTLLLEQRMGHNRITAAYPLPCVVSVENEAAVPRIPSLRRRLSAGSAPVTRLTLEVFSDTDPGRYGSAGSATRVVRTYRPPETVGKVVLSEETLSPQALLDLILGKEAPSGV